MVQLLQVHHQFVGPERGPLAHGGQLRRLEVGKAQGGKIAVLHGKLGKAVNEVDQLLLQQEQALPHQDHIGVVPHVAAGGAQVDNGHRAGAEVAIGMDMGHDVVPQLPLIPGRGGVVDFILVRLHLVDLGLCDGQPQLHLCPGQRDPQPPPSGELLIRRENIEHFRAGVAAGEGAFIGVRWHGDSSFYMAPAP